MKTTIALTAAVAVLGVAVIAPRESASGSTNVPRTVRLDGAAQKVGNGTARAYIIVDERDAPVEVGVALSESVMEGLPNPKPMDHNAPMVAGEHLDMHDWLLALPAKNPTPYQFVQFGWNPKGHEPPGVWDTPHFDFHFYTVPLSVRNEIVPTDPKFAEKAARFPAENQRAQFYLDAAAAAKTTPAAMTVPEMGLHWVDVRTPEIQAMAGKPEAYKPFTTTFIYGSWNGEFIFAEPMITRAFLMTRGDTLIQVPSAGFAKPGYYPAAYRVRWDESSREYLVSLTQFARQE